MTLLRNMKFEKRLIFLDKIIDKKSFWVYYHIKINVGLIALKRNVFNYYKTL
jgi:hypothetical protein